MKERSYSCHPYQENFFGRQPLRSVRREALFGSILSGGSLHDVTLSPVQCRSAVPPVGRLRPARVGASDAGESNHRWILFRHRDHLGLEVSGQRAAHHSLQRGTPISLVYRNERSDTSEVCGDTNNGFDIIWNWAVLGDGTHTAVVYDNGVEFARSTFEVWTLGEEFVRGASGECRVPDFPMPGETTTFEWNQNTQHMEMVEPTGEWIAVAYGTERSSCRSAYGVSLNASTREAARAEAYSLCLMQASADNLPLGVCHSEERYNARILDGKLERCLSISFCEALPWNGQNVCGLITNSGETPAEAEEAAQAECESLIGTTVTTVTVDIRRTTVTTVDIICPTPAGMVRGSP